MYPLLFYTIGYYYTIHNYTLRELRIELFFIYVDNLLCFIMFVLMNKYYLCDEAPKFNTKSWNVNCSPQLWHCVRDL